VSLVGSGGGAIGKDKTLSISFRSPVASKVSDDAGWPLSWWGAADTEPQTLRPSPSRSWSTERSGYGTRIVGGSGEDVIDTVVKLTAVGGKVGAIDGVGSLKYERYG
jgi:hypothetical protein